jgi:hypothetical protein
VCEINTQLFRVAILVSTQLENSVFELAAWVVRKWLWLRAESKATKRFCRREGGPVLIGSKRGVVHG